MLPQLIGFVYRNISIKRNQFRKNAARLCPGGQLSQFNRGLAGRIFEEVRQHGAKVVMKNNAAECVLMSPEEYVRLMDEVNDASLLAERENDRMMIIVIGARADDEVYDISQYPASPFKQYTA